MVVRVLTSGAVALVLAAGMAAVPATAAHAEPAPAHLTAQTEPLDHDGGRVRTKAWTYQRPSQAAVAAPVWPEPATVTVAPARTKAARAGKLPVSVAAAGPVTVQLLDRRTAPAAWRDGLLMRVSGAKAALAVNYSGFRTAYGAGWASRLGLWQVPECALTTPDSAACTATKIPSTNDPKTGTVTARSAGTGGLVALAAGAAGPSGDFSATSLAPSSTWSSGDSSGDFSWSYPMRTPPAVGGPAPTLAVSYESGSVDGRSEVTNNQPSWLGEGFEFTPGYIERRYVNCADDMTDGSNTKRTGDLCWRSDNATLSLNGMSTELVFQAGKGWHPRTEDGSAIVKLTGAGNGDDDGEYWRVTGTDGTQYFFGLHKLPGETDTTDSTWTVPVAGNQKLEPCRGDTFADSFCSQAWRWNLDYAVDVHGNTMSYWYTKESNKYAQNATESKDVTYNRGGYLNRIDYGTWDRGTADRSVSATSQVVFTTADRCVTTSCGTHDLKNWPDTPWDQECTGTGCGTKFSPTFWSTRRLSQVSTRVWDTTRKTPGWQDVDSWQFTHSFPGAGDESKDAGMWLDQIVNTGKVGTAVSLPPVSFLPISLPNRVLTMNTSTSSWLRIDQIITESGAKIDVDWDQTECSATNLPADAYTNTMRCYPVMVPDPDDPTGKKVVPQWWHKHRVKSISESDLPTWSKGHQAPPTFTTYEYVGAPAWHYSDDDGLTPKNRQTWNQFRGYKTVKTRVGDEPGKKTLTVSTYLRGMHGDRLKPSGGVRSVPSPVSLGDETVYDEDQYAGMVREEVVYNGTETKPVSKTVTVPWRSEPTATRTINGDEVTARFLGSEVTYDAVALGVDGSRGWRTTREQTWFSDKYGTVDKKQDDGDANKAGDEQCVVTAYIRNADRNMNRTVKQTTTTALPCGSKPTRPEHLLADVRYYYDGATSVETPPTYGAVTQIESLLDWTAAAGTVWQRTRSATFDAFGRQRSTTDVKGNLTKTGYSPDKGGPVLAKVVTNPLGWDTTTSLDPYWGSPVGTVDQNGRTTTIAHDGLGRVWRAWGGGWSYEQHKDSPSVEYTYSFAPERDAYPYTTTRTLNAGGGYTTVVNIMDSLMRDRQTQTAAVGEGVVVTDKIYDKLGRVATTYNAHVEPGQPSGELWWEPEWSVPAINRTVYDNAGRVTAQLLYATDGTENLVKKLETTTQNEGDLIRVTPPEGSTPTTTLVNAAGRTVELRQHTGTNGVDGPFQSTKYTYDARGKLAKVVDDKGNRWSYDFDVRGNVIAVSDPDKGASASQYNRFGELEKSTDARGESTWFVYDTLGRKSELRDDSATGALRAKWKYDKLYTTSSAGSLGQLTETYRYEPRPGGGTDIYKWQAGGFTERYQPTNVNYVVPDSSQSGPTTWSIGYGYSPYDGSPASVLYPAAGGLPAETVTTKYDGVTGLPSSLETTATGVGTYVSKQLYTAYAEPTVTTRLTSGGLGVEEATYYDLTTRRVNRTSVQPESVGKTVADRKYDYDATGNIQSIIDAPQVGRTDKQCFRYDTLRRLTTAWTPKAEVDCRTDPSVADLDGPAPYWLGWTVDGIGNRTEEASHTASAEVTRKFVVPASGDGAARPHSVDAVTTTATDGRAAVTAAYTYDKAGNTICRPVATGANDCAAGGGSQRLIWDAEGRLAEVSANGALVESNVYDADGGRLLRRDSTGSTLYLPGQEVRRNATGGLDGVRYYSFGGKIIASRDSKALSWLFSDHQGTQHTSIRADSQAVTSQRQLPYGGSRGPASVWPNQRSFVGGTADPAGLVHLGAREYDTGLGRFISVDPLQDMNDPQQWNAYSYANNNPTTMSDPTGQHPADPAEFEEWQQRQNRRLATPRAKAPKVRNPELQRKINSIYLRDVAEQWEGDGKVGSAVRIEISEGRQVGGKWHYKKAAELFKGLSDILEEDRNAVRKGKPPVLPGRDRQIAMDEARELWKSLNTDAGNSRFVAEITSTAQGRAILAESKPLIAEGGSKQSVKEFTGAQFRPMIRNGKVVRIDSTAGPRLAGVAGMLSVVGDLALIHQGGEAIASDEPAAELNEMLCQMAYSMCQHGGQMTNDPGMHWGRDQDGNYSYWRTDA